MLKQVPILLLSVISAAAFAANTHTLRSSNDMHIKKSSVSYSKRTPAQMGCKLYTLDDTDNHASAKLVATAYSQIMNVGTHYTLTVKFPAPYDQVSVHFQHDNVAFYETGYDTFMPYLASEFWDEQSNFQYQGVSFDIENARSGSSVMLRGSAVAEDNNHLFYQCAMTFLK